MAFSLLHRKLLGQWFEKVLKFQVLLTEEIFNVF